MKKLELTKNLKEECQITNNEAAIIVDLFFDKISDALAGGDRVEIRGLCSFFVKEYKSYQEFRDESLGTEFRDAEFRDVH